MEVLTRLSERMLVSKKEQKRRCALKLIVLVLKLGVENVKLGFLTFENHLSETFSHLQKQKSCFTTEKQKED